MTIYKSCKKSHDAAISLLEKLIQNTPWDLLTIDERFLVDELLQILYDHAQDTMAGTG